MIKTAAFKNFRGFEDFQLSDLSPVTLISGKNNVGKSSILEGIFLALVYRDTNSFLMLNSLRGSSVGEVQSFSQIDDGPVGAQCRKLLRPIVRAGDGAQGSSTRAMWQRAAQRAMRPHGEVGEITYFAANFPSVSPPLLTGNME